MGVQEWRISGPDNHAWTAEETARIMEAVKTFQAALPGVSWAKVTLDNVVIFHNGESARVERERIRYGRDK